MRTLHKEEEHRVIVPTHYHYNEEKKYKPNFKQLLSSWKGILGISATLATILAVVFPAYQTWSERPQLNLEKLRVDIQSPANIPEIIKTLDKIESDHYAVTGEIILDLRKEVELLLEKELEIKIPDFGESYDNVNNSWINQNSLDEEDIKQIKGMIKNAITNIENKKSQYASDNNNSDLQSLDQLIVELKELSPTTGVQKKQIAQSTIVMDVVVENRSNSENWIRDPVVIRFYRNQEQSFPVVLYLQKEQNEDINENQSQDTMIDGNSLKRLRFESKSLKNLETKHKNFLESAFTNEYNYIFVLEDIKDNIWSVEGTVLTYDLDFHTKKLEYETEMILKSKKTKK